MTVVFDEDGLPLATNHLGWNVERLTTDGWKPIHEDPIEVKSDARAVMELAQTISPKAEYRIYEALEFPVMKK
jgi:hypothetical protein